eukprot:GFUD01004715.1.p1 GENE.GFUD01004715.1~~GFUD01004715.1.p1  ORF type:complete len:316 (+),score=81.62 GFUD01004715.1:240-1187(+)
METENFSLRWNDFEENISSGLKDLRNSNHFFDVTLLSDNGQVGAHKLILSACSSFFREILVSNPHQHPLIYLKGVSKEEIINLLNFMYCGEVNVAQDELSSFLAAAEDLKVKGLTNNGASDINGAKKRKIDTESEINNMKKLKNNLQTDPKKTSEDVPILDVVQVKSEPTTASGDTIAAAPTSKSLAPADYEVEADDFPYDEYQNQDGGFEDDFVSNIGGSKDLDVDDPSESIFPCNVCGRTFNSSSHCNRHYVTVHGNPVPVSCEVCGKNFKNQDSCSTHLRKFHDIYSKQNRRREAPQDNFWLQGLGHRGVDQ